MLKRLWVLIKSRNKEFYRDKSALGWNFLFPFLIIIGFSFMFNDDNQTLYKVGIINKESVISAKNIYEKFEKTKYIQFVEFKSRKEAEEKLNHHKIDLIIDYEMNKYLVSKSSPKGYIAEKLLFASSLEAKPENQSITKKEEIEGYEVPYLEWLFPGVLGMNMMFSALFGIGYVVVRYRKNGVLKRFSVTPVKSYEFLLAQVLSRIYLLLLTTFIVYTVCALLFKFTCRGSYFSLILITILGGFSMISLGLVVAARSSSEEFAGGILNLISWPMMFLSEVWFSMEGASPWVKYISKLFPLTHMIEGARKIMNDGATLYDVRYNFMALIIMSFLFMGIGSFLFKWKSD